MLNFRKELIPLPRLNFPLFNGQDKLFVDYDKEADVLYVSFGKPQKAENSIQGEDGIIRRKKSGKIVGLTILNASRFRK